MKEDNILLTGGHAATTAISVIQEIKKRNSDSKLTWVGPKSAVEGKYVPTLASIIMPKLGVKFTPIITGRLQRKFTIWTIPSLLKIPYGIVQSLNIVKNIKPKVVVSFGGYAAVPVCFAAWIFRVPVIIHEQTVAVGLANKISAFFAKKILIAREESFAFFLKEKTLLIGNPVTNKISIIKAKTKIGNPVTIYITGGSSGAQRINTTVAEVLYELLKNYKIIHQTGKLDYEEFKNKKENFPTDLKKNYEVYDFIDPDDTPQVFSKADIVISRAGANTIAEIMITKRPAIIIPISWTSHDEQTKNAQLLEKSGLGLVINEKELTGNNLLNGIEYVIKNWKSMVQDSDYSLAELDKNAAKKFVDVIESES